MKNKQLIKELKQRYEKAKSAKVGNSCNCASCNTIFIKSNYQQVFCKTKVGTTCKDFYWNNVDEKKRNNITRISPANAAFMAIRDIPAVFGYGDSQKAIDKEDREKMELEEDGSFDAHQCYVDRCEWCECLICRCEY